MLNLNKLKYITEKHDPMKLFLMGHTEKTPSIPEEKHIKSITCSFFQKVDD